jgi:16S rRNA (guanine527-N7)-methyltransferase
VAPAILSLPLPPISVEEFDARLQELAPEPLSARTLEILFAHYQELRRWNLRISLVGPGTRDEVLSRHYGEALAALAVVPKTAAAAVDLGSGAGFPGFVLAAARPDLAVTLVEARERKCAFLQAAARRAALPVQCLNVRVALPLPAGLPEHLDLLTVRALRLDPKVLGALAERLASHGSALFWAGQEGPELPAGWRVQRSLPLAGSERRRIVEARPA